MQDPEPENLPQQLRMARANRARMRCRPSSQAGTSHANHAPAGPRRGTLAWRFYVLPMLPTIALAHALLGSADPWADSVVEWNPGLGGVPGYDDPQVAIGEPTRITVDGEIVSPFLPAWGTSEILSLGAGGWIVLAFDEPVEDHPDNPWGIDMIVFGNPGFTDASWPDGVANGLFGADGGSIEVSSDGTEWVMIESAVADGPWPTLAWSDTEPYSVEPGNQPTAFTKPMNPSNVIDGCIGLDYEELLSLYEGSGGGVGIDLAPTGLDSIRYVRISNPVDAFLTPEIDALADVVPDITGDVDHDGQVNIVDLLAVLAAWGMEGSHPADIDGSGLVDVIDLLLVISSWDSEP